IELALEIDSGRYPSLHRFHTWLNELRQNSQEAPDETPVAGDGNRVRIMTIHGAKGLEAPIVFLADASSEPKRDNSYRALVDWPSGQARPQSFFLTGKKSQQDAFTRQRLEREQREEDRESANLLYVALTRARQLLYISGCQSRRGAGTEKGDGWYGHITRALAPKSESFDDEAQVISSGQMPTQVTKHKVTSTEHWPIPEGLDKPLPRSTLLQGKLYEIAPSRAVSDAYINSGTDEDGRQRGIAIHRILEYLLQTPADQQRPTTIANELAMEENDADFQSWWKEAQQVINSPELAFLFDASNYQKACNEVPIQYQQNGRTVYGIIDRLVINKDEIIVVDYKTHQSATDKNIDELAEKYHPQMDYYLEGVRKLRPDLKTRGLLLFTSSKQVFEYST
ncbi:MAG: PD-(D/E)XK nuclease family protein, partial [Gammaproteobacteria bacterium]|nr:PD-(D/E)XK nuclease family protein [Gammaproteobacteria bacterium]